MEEVAERKNKEAYDMNISSTIAECKQCANKYRQFAEWLRDYKRLLELQERFERYTMQDDMHLVTIRQIKEVMKGEWL